MQVTVPRPRVVSHALAAVALFFALGTIGGYLYKAAYGRTRSSGLVRLPDVDQESSVATWFSAALLLLASVLLATVGSARQADDDPDALHWYGLAVIFLGLSIDEASMIHEMFETGMRMVLDVDNPLMLLWLIPYSAFAVLVFVTYRRFLGRLPAGTQSLFVVAGGLYVGGAVAVEAMTYPYARPEGLQSLTYVVISTAEELLEMLGIIVFIHALLAYLRDHVREVRVSLGD